MSRVTLTFDNGPDPDVTPKVLDLLRDRGLQAHFYVLGKFLRDPACRAQVVRAVAEGHVVGNHSFSHEVPLGDDDRKGSVEAEILVTERLLAPLIGDARRFRPFGGGGKLGPHLLSEEAVATLTVRHYSCVLWNSVPRDWVDPDGWPARALADCDRQSHAVIVLHDLPGASLAKLPAFLDALEARGHEVVPDLPRACTPIVDGVVVGSLDGLVRRAAVATVRGGEVRS